MDFLLAFTPAGGAAYYGGCKARGGFVGSEEGLVVMLVDPTSGSTIAGFAWIQGTSASGHYCDANAYAAGNDEPVPCPLGMGSPYVLPMLS
jgi:hypothetical protein